MIKLIDILNEIEIGITPEQCFNLLIEINKIIDKNIFNHNYIKYENDCILLRNVNEKYVDQIDLDNVVGQGKHICFSMNEKTRIRYYQDLLRLKKDINGRKYI